MWTDHTEYEEYQKLQLSMVVRYQHNNTLCKISSDDRYRKNPPKYRDFFNIAHPYPQPMQNNVVLIMSAQSRYVCCIKCMPWAL